jgi:hypothetical protein
MGWVNSSISGALIMYTNAQYIAQYGVNISIRVEINGLTNFVPLDPANTDYANIMALLKEGKLTIAPADEVSN